MAELEETAGTAAVPEVAGDPIVETPTEEIASATGADPTTPADEPDFTDPAKLPPELQPLAKRLQASYTKRMEKVANERKANAEAIQLVSQFRSDPNFAANLIRTEAQRLGIPLSTADAKAAADVMAQPTGDVPAQFVELAKRNLTASLPPEMQWMADSLAKGLGATLWEQHKATVLPLHQERQQARAAERNQTYQSSATKLSELAPGWEEHEDDMLAALEYLRSDAMHHPKFGDKLQLLHNVVTGNSVAIRQAMERMKGAAQSRTTTGQSGRTSAPNLEDRVRKATNLRAAFDIAKRAAEAELANA